MIFVAMDFETGDPKRDSACALALIVVVNGRIARRYSFLIQPPRRPTPRQVAIHGLTWDVLAKQPTFAQLWPRLRKILALGDFWCAHAAGFDASVLQACCARAGVTIPRRPVLDTVQLVRRTLELPRANLQTACDALGIALDHHLAISDAAACAQIVLTIGHVRVMRELARQEAKRRAGLHRTTLSRRSTDHLPLRR